MQATAPDTEELAHFREKWKQEIRGRVQHSPKSPQSSDEGRAVPLPARLQSALETYSLAVSQEQSGNHPEATRLYRNAFRLDKNVDKAYHQERITLDGQQNPPSSSLAVKFSKISAEKGKNPGFAQVTASTETLALLLESWPQPLSFVAENEARNIPISRLPDELIVRIIFSLARSADVNAIERFAAVSRKARALTLDSAIWRKLVQLTMVPPQFADQPIPLRELAERYRFDYRRVYVEHPRLRLDGVYVSICHYVRNGLGENPWVTISHLITYRRFLRFLPNGEVLSYRANEDQDIADVVHALHPDLRRKDLCIGKWRLIGTTVVVTNLVNRIQSGHTGSANYSFQMSLTLKSRPSLGRWNKLDFLDYESVNLLTGETSSLSLRHERPFWFSKVRSY